MIAIDNNQQQLDIAQAMAQQKGLQNIEFILYDVYDFESLNIKSNFIYSRWLLLFLSKPKAILKMFFDKLNEGGVIVCESLQKKKKKNGCPESKYDTLIQELHSLENNEDTILGCYRNLLVSAIKR